MIPLSGWTQLDSFIFHYCQLSSISGCGKYRAACGAKGWVNTLVPITEALPWCSRCVRIIDQGTLPDTAFALEASECLPPNQQMAKRWPVIHLGDEPKYESYDLTVDGLVMYPFRATLEGLQFLPIDTLSADMHCVMRWSMKNLTWSGILLTDILRLVKPNAEYAMIHADKDYMTNLHVSDLAKGILATHVNGEPIPTKYGGPLRLIIPHLYAWKSPKWIRRIEFVSEDKPGTWEQRGLHNRGDVWQEQRFEKTGT